MSWLKHYHYFWDWRLLEVSTFYVVYVFQLWVVTIKGLWFLKKMVKIALCPLTRWINKIDIDLLVNYKIKAEKRVPVFNHRNPSRPTPPWQIKQARPSSLKNLSEVGFSGFCFLAMLLRRFAKIPVSIFAFVAASSAVGHSSKYNLSSCLSWYDLHFSIFSARAWNRLQNISKHCTDITTWQPLYVFVGFKRCTLSFLHTWDERITLLKVTKVNYSLFNY